MFLAEHVTGWFRVLILVAPCWMEAPWLPRVLNMLEDVSQCSPVIRDFVMDIFVGQVLKGIPYLHLTPLTAQRCVALTVVPFLSLSGSGRGNVSVYNKGLPVMLERMGRLVC